MIKISVGERKIISGSYQDYILLFGESRTAYSDLYAKKSAAENRLYIMFEDNFPAGYICASFDRHNFFVHYAYTALEKRNRGIFTSLLKYLIALDENYPVVVQSSTTDKKYSKTVIDVCGSLGFQKYSVCKTFRADWNSL